MGISLLCGVKDREEHLLRSYPSWLECSGIDEIIIVDWGSKRPVSAVIEKHEKVKIVRVNPSHSKYWSFSQAFNAAARFSSGEHFVFINADEIIVDKNEISSLAKPNRHFFYEGTSWDSRRGHGVYFLYISKDLFWEVNGFNERLMCYGYDDVDLRIRLEDAGATLTMSGVKIEHIAHGASHETRENSINNGISKYHPWKKLDNLIEFTNIEVIDGVMSCDIEESHIITKKTLSDREMLLVFVLSVNLPWLY